MSQDFFAWFNNFIDEKIDWFEKMRKGTDGKQSFFFEGKREAAKEIGRKLLECEDYFTSSLIKKPESGEQMKVLCACGFIGELKQLMFNIDCHREGRFHATLRCPGCFNDSEIVETKYPVDRAASCKSADTLPEAGSSPQSQATGQGE